MKRIYIIGPYGCGKSTIAEKLSKKLKIKHYDLDEIKYKRKYDIIRSVKERLSIINKISKQKSWITEGSWTSYAKPLYKKANLVILITIPKLRVYSRIIKRHFERKFNKTDYKENNIKTTINIIKKVKEYYNNKNKIINLKIHKEYIKKYAKKFIVIKNDKDIKHLLEEIA